MHRQHHFVFTRQAQNTYTQQCIQCLRTVARLNTDASQLVGNLSSMRASFQGKTSFSHIQRLHNMLYAYGATVIEIVRRKEFGGWGMSRQTRDDSEAHISSVLLPTRAKYLGSHGQTVVSRDEYRISWTCLTVSSAPTSESVGKCTARRCTASFRSKRKVWTSLCLPSTFLRHLPLIYLTAWRGPMSMVSFFFGCVLRAIISF